MLIGFFSTSAAPGGINGLFYGGGLDVAAATRSWCAVVPIVWTGVFTAVIGLAIKYTIGWRIAEEDEVDGIDFVAARRVGVRLRLASGGGGRSLGRRPDPSAQAGAEARGVNA